MGVSCLDGPPSVGRACRAPQTLHPVGRACRDPHRLALAVCGSQPSRSMRPLDWRALGLRRSRQARSAGWAGLRAASRWPRVPWPPEAPARRSGVPSPAWMGVSCLDAPPSVGRACRDPRGWAALRWSMAISASSISERGASRRRAALRWSSLSRPGWTGVSCLEGVRLAAGVVEQVVVDALVHGVERGGEVPGEPPAKPGEGGAHAGAPSSRKLRRVRARRGWQHTTECAGKRLSVVRR